MRFTKIDANMGKWTKENLDAMLKRKRMEARIAKTKKHAEHAKEVASDLGKEAASLGSKAWNWIKENPTEALVGVMAIAIMDIEEDIDELLK